MAAINNAQKRNLDEAAATPPFKRRKLNTSVGMTNGNTNENNICSSTPERGAFIVLEGIDRSGKSTQCRELLAYLDKKDIKYEFLRYPDRTSHSGKLINDYLQGNTSLNDRAVHLLFASNRHEDTPKILKLLNNGINIICDRYSYSGVAYSAAKIAINNNNSKENTKSDIECKAEEIINVATNGDSSNGSKDDNEKENVTIKNENKLRSMDWQPIMDLDWCLTCEEGLPKPDKIIYLHLDLSEAQKRGGFGNERYEKVDFLKRVQICYENMQEKYKQQDNCLWKVLDANRSKEEIHKDIIKVVHDTMTQVSNKEISFM